jgi:RHS repeat-associated protein
MNKYLANCQHKIGSCLLLVFLFLGALVHAQTPVPLKDPYSSSAKVNFVRTWDAKAPEQNPATLVTRPLRDVQQATAYFDGLGRPLQTVVKQGSLATGNNPVDLVSAVTYDEFGREQYKYLPSPANNAGSNPSINDGFFKANPFQQQAQFYNAQLSSQPGETNVGPNSLNWAYGQTTFEASPLNRAQEAFAPGTNWVGTNAQGSESNRHSVKTKYYFNTLADDVKQWTVYDVANNWGTYAVTGVYNAGELYKNITVDEQGKQIIEFKDKDGQVILKKVQFSAAADNGSGSNHNDWLCTYYIYDDLGSLRLVVQPRGVELLVQNSWNTIWNNSVILKEQSFRYEYDGRRRMTMKKVPGAGEVYMVYDKWDRLILTQDAIQRPQNLWIFTKYDILNRPIMTGNYFDPTNIGLPAMIAHVKNNESWLIRYEAIDLSKPRGYTTTQTFPYSEAPDLLTLTYYDNYDWATLYGSGFSARENSGDPMFFTPDNNNYPYPQPITATSNTRGMVTGSWTKVLGTSKATVKSIFYDDKGRTVQVKSNNITGDQSSPTIILSTQYDFSGKVLRTFYRQFKADANHHVLFVMTTYNYDDLGRPVEVKKWLDAYTNEGHFLVPEKTIVRNEYDALGQLKKKTLGNNLESLTYDYNVRGWLLGANRNYLLNQGTTDYADKYFGFELGYDNCTKSPGSCADGVYQYNGNISTSVWKSKGDQVRRKFNFQYDAANRLGKAGFYQNSKPGTGGTWNYSEANFSVGGFDADNGYMMKYDANGNILSMIQHGITPGNNDLIIDAMRYKYKENYSSNQLEQVWDDLNAPDTKLGDFHYAGTKTGSSVDYTYDANGNLVTDVNKNISAITYNYLNLPKTIQVTGKGSIEYLYDATGNKLEKTVNETGKPAKSTLYLDGFVYEDNVLQFLPFEEGRIRYAKRKFTTGDSTYQLQYDYFLKDHLGNVRMVLTEQTDTAQYLASMETAYRAKEEQLFSNIAQTVIAKTDVPGGYPVDGKPVTSPNDLVARVSGNGNKIGPAIVLKVMSGDKVDIGVSHFYRSGGSYNDGLNMVPTILSSLAGGIIGAAGQTKGSLAQLSADPGPLATAIRDLQNNHQQSQAGNNKPKAYLNWLLLDEQMKYVEASSGAIPVSIPNEVKPISQGAIPMTKNGFLYIYVSNETQNWDVFFDNLSISHYSGPLTEETHYYPFGLTIAEISSKALKSAYVENDKKYNGIELEGDLGIDIYDAQLRELDPQVGRWWQVDPKTENMEMWSPYASNYDNPIRFADPLGDEGEDCCSGFGKFVKRALGGGAGVIIGTVDNAFGTNIRGSVAANGISDPNIAKGWNTGLDVADIGAISVGGAESTFGVGLTKASIVVTAGTGGLSVEVTGPSAALGMGMAAHGVLVMENGAKNLASQNGRVEIIQIDESNKIPRDELNPPNKPGNAPTFKKDNTPVEIHHEGQNPQGPFREMHWQDHRGKGNDKINHPDKAKPSKVDRRDFRKDTREYWKQEFPYLPPIN